MSKTEMKKSTKVLTWISGVFLSLCLLMGIAYGVATMDSSGGSNNSTQTTQSTEASPF